MFNKFSSRIILAWIVLGLAMILLTLSVSFAQNVSVVRKDDGEVKFKYKSKDKKNSQDIDTTFTAKNDDEFYSIMQDISDRHGLNLSMLKNHNLGQLDDKSKQSFSYNINVTTDDKKSKKGSKNSNDEFADIHIEINKSMQDLEADMRELEASIANMKFDFQFDGDEIDDAKEMKITIDKNGKQTRIIKKHDLEQLNIPDSLDNADHVIVFGDKGELAPELEKVITNEDGSQIFIYKRKKEK